MAKAAAAGQSPTDSSPEPEDVAHGGANERSQEPVSTTETEPSQTYRTWSDATGKFQVEALLVGCQDDKVSLRKRDGLTVVVPVPRLCAADQAYLAASTFVTEDQSH